MDIGNKVREAGRSSDGRERRGSVRREMFVRVDNYMLMESESDEGAFVRWKRGRGLWRQKWKWNVG